MNHAMFNYGNIRIIHGVNSLEALGEEVAGTCRKVLIITDEGVRKAGHVERVEQLLKEFHISTVIYDRIQTDPLDTMVEEALLLLQEHVCDLVIGLGGGSSMDVAKCVSVMKNNDGHIMEYTRINPNRRSFSEKRMPLLLIPTTSGTGSELSPFAVITNTAINRKSNVTSDKFLPDVVIMDPKLVTTLDQKWTVSTAFDALTHAIDGYTVKEVVLHENPFVDCFALKSIALLSKSMRTAYACKEDIDARYNVMMGSHFAGAILSAGTGASHGLANMLSKYYHVPHGESVGILLPYVMEYNLMACPQRFADIAKALGLPCVGMTALEAGRAAIAEVKQIAKDMNLPTLADYIKDASEIENFLEESLDNSCNYANVREITRDAAAFIFLSAHQGA